MLTAKEARWSSTDFISIWHNLTLLRQSFFPFILNNLFMLSHWWRIEDTANMLLRLIGGWSFNFIGERKFGFNAIFHKFMLCSVIKLQLVPQCVAEIQKPRPLVITPTAPFMICLWKKDQPYFVQLLHSYYSHGTLKSGRTHQIYSNAVWLNCSNMYTMTSRGKMPKMFLSSQRLIRRNPNLAFYFNWNPIFVISTNLLMVR